ncbi:MAG: peptidoglycan DD-metalloendopeptidase family protein [Candidatus Cloacimonetes bacterium]|nr:peptidoglycan DD-metalloendopeptidase family protein [Candidatus Cloacimonadota bacterium]
MPLIKTNFPKIFAMIVTIFFLTEITSLSSNPKYYTPSEKYHIVKKGETLSGIGKKYSISVDKLKIFNDLKSDKIFIGQKVYLIPRKNHKREFVTTRKIPKSKFYIVKPKESIHRIGKMFDLGILDLVEFNDLKSLSLNPGQKIWLENGHLTKTKLPKKKVEQSKARKKKETIPETKKIIPNIKKKLFQPVKGKVTSEFGMRDGMPHKGIDIANKTGEPIYAALKGKVVFSGTQRGYGNVIILEHDNYIMTVYAHNETNLVRLGDFVQKGQPIATLGATGTTTGPHLHFEYRINGKAIDPRTVLPDL